LEGEAPVILDPDWLNRFVPFALIAGKQPHWNLQRILEGLIIAGITGMITMYGVQKTQEVQMSSIREELYRMRSDMQQRIEEVRISVRENTSQASSREDRIENKLDAHLLRDKR
jgi:hypothetical protein